MKTILAMWLALVLSSSAFAETKIQCTLTARVFMKKTSETSMVVHVAVKAVCDEGTHKVYESRSATLDTSTPDEVGALVLRMMAEEVAKAMRADGAPFTAEEILEHAQIESVEP